MSGNDIGRICFRFFAVNCCLWFTLVRWCPLLSAAIVTQLVTRPRCQYHPSGGMSSARPFSARRERTRQAAHRAGAAGEPR